MSQDQEFISDQKLSLERIVVIATPEGNPLAIILNPKEAQLPLPASDGADYLKTTPGFAVVRSGGANGDPAFRGQFGSRLNLLTNGGVILGSCPNRMDSPSSYISPESFDQITIIKGPQTVLYGGGASGATIRFDRLPPSYDEFTAKAEVGFLAGSYGRLDEYIDATLGDANVYARLNANHGRSSDYKDGDGQKVPSAWEKWNVDLALGWTPHKNAVIEFSAGGGDGEARYAARGMDGSRFKRESFGLRFENREISTVLTKLEGAFYYNHADHVMDNYHLRKPSGTMPMPMWSNPTRTVYGGRLAATISLGEKTRLTNGLDAQFDRHDASSTASPKRRKDLEIDKIGLFSELKTEVSPNNVIIAGLRGDYAKAKDFRVLPANYSAYERERHNVLPSAFIRYERSFEGIPLQTYIGLGYTERFPDYWELTQVKNFPRGMTPTLFRVFPDLKPEKTGQLDIGFQYKTDNLDLWLSGYAGVIKDYILFKQETTVGMMGTTINSRTQNVDARTFGGELGASYLFVKKLRLSGSLAYAYAKNTDEDKPLPQIPPLEAKFSADYQTQNSRAGVLWRVVAKQDRVAINEGNVVGRDFSQSRGYGVFSIYAGHKFADRLNISAGVDNLFDSTYSEHLNLAGNSGWGYPANVRINEPGRIAWVKLTAVF
ncbi:MAG: TonB-dependent copper receptor [Deltaproteobacteria bacterium]|nr:TonB-dependent copper receptor [Deltaproteobacteria bacterium]